MDIKEQIGFERKTYRANIAETWARASIKIALAILIAASGVGYAVSGRPIVLISYTSGAN